MWPGRGRLLGELAADVGLRPAALVRRDFLFPRPDGHVVVSRLAAVENARRRGPGDALVGPGVAGQIHLAGAVPGLGLLVRQPPREGNRFAGSILGTIPVPAPGPMLRGIDTQKADFDQGRPADRNDRWHERVVWYYYALGLAAKLPLAMPALTAMGVWFVIGDIRRRLKRGRDDPSFHGSQIGEKAIDEIFSPVLIWDPPR